MWDTMRLSHFNELQPGCEPIKLESNKNVRGQGLVILLHGFSACPQQYEQLAPRLAKLGFDVLVPLLPGHGIKPIQFQPRIDNTDLVPRTVASWKAFRNEINDLAESYRGKRSITGLSMGTNLALSAYIKRPDLYSNVVGISPKLRNETSFLHGIFSNNIHLFNIDEWILNRKSGWDSCLKDAVLENKPRSGFCSFQNKNAIAMLKFGNETIKDSKLLENTSSAKIQIVLSHNDDGVANNGALELADNLLENGDNLDICTMPTEVPHSMFSPYDRPHAKPWIDFLFSGIENSLMFSEPIPSNFDEGGTITGKPATCAWTAPAKKNANKKI